MKLRLTRDEFRMLRWPLVCLLAALLVGAAAVFASARWLDRQSSRNAAVSAELRQVQTRLSSARQEEQNLMGYASTYKALAQKGLFGEERRLDWIELIDRLRNRKRLFAVDYEIAAQRPLPLPPHLQTPNLEVLGSRVRVKLALLHEGDLLAFLDGLRHSDAGLYRIESCTVERLPPGGDVQLGPKLGAECQLEWITMKRKSAGSTGGAR